MKMEDVMVVSPIKSGLVLWQDCFLVWFTADLLAAWLVSFIFCLLFYQCSGHVCLRLFLACPDFHLFSGQPFSCWPTQTFLPFPLSSSYTYSSSQPSPHFHPHDQPFNLLSLLSFFSCLPSLCGKSFWCATCACLLWAGTHTNTHLCSSLCRSFIWPSSNQSETCLLDQPNICRCCLSQSEWALMLVPVSIRRCFMCFLFCLRERKCGFPARGGSWINSTLSAFIPHTQLITAAEGYTVARLAAQREGCCGLCWHTAVESERRRLFSVCVWWRGGGEKDANLTRAGFVAVSREKQT